MIHASKLAGLAALALVAVLSASALAGEGQRFVVRGYGTRAVAYPAQSSAVGRAPIVYLHGICGGPDRGCDAFALEATRFGPFVCPQANVSCESGASWGGAAFQKLDAIDRGMQLVAERTEGALDVGRPGILIGFSQGGYAAVELVKARPGRFRGLFLVGASVRLDPKQMRSVGVTRVVLAAGRYDGTYAKLSALHHELAGSAIESRFVDLGPVGHTYVPSAEHESAVHEAWSWLDEAEEVMD